MKSFIGGKSYNTETDKPIASSRMGRLISDFGYIDETLYRTENGDWYLHGVVVSYSNYNSTTADSSTNSEHIIPLDDKQACGWLKRTNNTAALKKYFD